MMTHDDMMVYDDDNISLGAATNVFVCMGGCAPTRSFGRELVAPVL